MALHALLAYVVIASAGGVALALVFIVAPYGRHERAGWGPRIRTRTAWQVMESPAVVVFAAVYLEGPHRWDPLPCFLLGLWMLHYVNRVFVYPARMRDEGKRTPVAIVAMALVFNSLNAYLNASWLSRYGAYPAARWLSWTLWLGVALFLAGRQINLRADGTLFRLRDDAAGYQIPRGGLYEYISCPNYFGELVEWSGWALATFSMAGLAFALFTAANLVPRALSHHRWYRQRFPDYPPRRKAILPFVL